jgi:hypothetical protein
MHDILWITTFGDAWKRLQKQATNKQRSVVAEEEEESTSKITTTATSALNVFCLPKQRKYVRFIPSQNTTPWKPRGTMCWHCADILDASPDTIVPLPFAYDDRRDIFSVMGEFCSFSCAKAYNKHAIQPHVSGINGTILTLFYKRATGKLCPIISSPPRQLLQCFGGPLSREEFRAAFSSQTAITYSMLPKKMTTYNHTIEEYTVGAHVHTHGSRSAAVAKKAAAISKNTTVDYEKYNVGHVRNETLRLRRPKPMKHDKNLLERTMGINIV